MPFYRAIVDIACEKPAAKLMAPDEPISMGKGGRKLPEFRA
jgi:hypothetical protein